VSGNWWQNEVSGAPDPSLFDKLKYIGHRARMVKFILIYYSTLLPIPCS
jgi:hypothetical protein